MRDILLTADSAPTAARTLTVEHLLYAVIGLIAALLRFTSLGYIPLSPSEASEALTVWSYWQPTTAFTSPGAPAYFTLTSLLSQVIGNSDWAMRLIPALFGLALVLLPFGLRPFIGRTAALIMSFFLALSPTLVATARTASGNAIALTALLAAVVAWLHWRETAERRWLYTLACAIGLGMAAASIFYGGLAALALAWLLARLLGPTLGKSLLNKDEAKEAWRTGALLGGSVFVAAAAFFLWNLTGLGSAANLPVRWLQQFGWPGDVLVWLDPILALGRYETGALILGTIAAAWATWRADAIPSFFTYWFLAALLLMLGQAGALDNVLLVTLPAYALVGMLADHVLSLPADWSRWPLGGMILVLGIITAKNIGRFARITLYSPDDASNLSLALTCIVLALIVAAFVFTWDRAAALQGVLVPLLLALAVLAWGNTWWLGHYAANDPRERWVQTATDDDVRLIVNTIREVAATQRGDPTSLALYSGVDSPVLRWYLRDLPLTQFGQGVPVAATTDLIITAQSAADSAAFGSDYSGTDFGLLRPKVDHVLAPTAALRWWLFRQSPQAIQEERVVLWLRADLLDDEE